VSHWAPAPIDRTQITLFAPTLDDSLSGDHCVRLFDEVLRDVDFLDWESMYIRVVGQPPIHPRCMASGILYGLSLGIRSSRKLEDACCNRLDFIWLMEGRKPDHATICKFRTQFGPQLKSLFQKIGRIAMQMGMITLNQVTLDGTDPRANNSRYNTARRATVEQKIAALDAQIEQAMKQAEEQDRRVTRSCPVGQTGRRDLGSVVASRRATGVWLDRTLRQSVRRDRVDRRASQARRSSTTLGPTQSTQRLDGE